MDRWIKICDYEVAKSKEEFYTYLSPYAINWSDEHQRIYYLSRKEQAKVRRWPLVASHVGLRPLLRPSPAASGI